MVLAFYVGTTCLGHQITKSLTSVDDLMDLDEEFWGCKVINGSIIINLLEESNLTNTDFEFLTCLESITGILSFVNVLLSEQITIPNLQFIGGNKLITGINASLQVLNVSGGDIIFPRLKNISRGDAVFEITNDVCGYLGIDWNETLNNGQLLDHSSNCSSKL